MAAKQRVVSRRRDPLGICGGRKERLRVLRNRDTSPAPLSTMTSETERTPDVNNACGSVADRANGTKPGELMRLVADGLTARGFDVRAPAYEGGCRMAI